MFERAKIAVFVLLAACSVGEVPDGGGTPDAGGGMGGGQSFEAMIKPIVMPKCTGCHAGGTLPTLTSFSVLEAKYKMKPGVSNILVTKGDHQNTTYFDPTQKATVTAWIDSLP
jgi:hypothetical protein